MSQAKTSSPPILLVGEELARFHNIVMACWAPEVHRDEEIHDVQSALKQLRYWKEDDPSERGNPPHINATIRLAICLRNNVGLMLDEVPEIASLWKLEFDDLEQALDELTGKYCRGNEKYTESVVSAWHLAQKALRLFERVEAKVPNETDQEDRDATNQACDAKEDAVTESTPFRESDREINCQEASEIWERSRSWWDSKVGDGKQIAVLNTGDHGAKMFSYLAADNFAKNQSKIIDNNGTQTICNLTPIKRRKPL